MLQDYDEIIAVIQKYVDGEIHADENIQAQAFFDDATIHGAMDGALWVGSINLLYELTAQASPNPQMRSRIDVLDITDTVAVARVVLEGGEGPDFVDYHSLVKTADGWKIAAKVFTALP